MILTYLKSLDSQTIEEIVLVILSISTFWIGTKQYITIWPITIFISLINLRFYYSNALYDRCIVNTISILLAFYGWYRWLYGGEGHTRLKKIAKTSLQEKNLLLLLSPFYMVFLYTLLLHLEAKMPFEGTLTNTLSMIGMWMTANKKKNSYLVWFIVNLLSIYIFYHVGRRFFMIKYIFYLFLSVKGYLLWRKQYDEQRAVV